MASVKGCNFPDDLYYNVGNNVWVRREADGSVVIGMTAYAAALAGRIVSCTPKKVGRSIELNKSAVTVESGKWVGPVKSPVAGEVVAVNNALASAPATINSDPYGSGWMVRLKPGNWDADSAALVTGTAAASAFEAKMTAEGFAGCQS
ncbi:MAG: glycine cleavage system protein GcvH [Betaproteobacteria bacterium]|nr:glycine cleavage system protein GcvH [Betaproteobacteria bacterium]